MNTNKTTIKRLKDFDIHSLNMDKKISLASMCLLFFIQLFLIVRFDGPQISDAANYIRLARNSIDLGMFYPNTSNLNDNYIHAPGFVNYLILLLKISSNLRIVYVFNLIWTFVLLFSLRHIISRLFNNNKIVLLFTIIFCITPVFWGKVVIVGCDVMFTALAFLALAILLHDKKYAPVISGIILAMANWVRPLSLAYMVGMLIYLFIVKKRKHIIKLLASFMLLIVCIGASAYFSSGYFVYQSTTSGVNLIMGANDDADGSYNTTCFQEGKIAYLDQDVLNNMTFTQRDSYYRKLAIQWIIKNPIKWILLFPKKIFYLYASADLTNNYVFVPSNNTYLQSYNYILTHWFGNNREFGDYILMGGQLLHMFIVLGSIVGIIKLIKQKNIIGLVPLFSIIFIGSLMTLITVCSARFNIPYLPILMIFTAVGFVKITPGSVPTLCKVK